jgi:hypothetical protein
MSNTGNSLQHKAAANARWKRVPTADRAAATQPGRDAHFQKFLDEYHGDVKQARNAWKAHFQNLARKRLAARKAKAADK